jgi:hypothetical protein
MDLKAALYQKQAEVQGGDYVKPKVIDMDFTHISKLDIQLSDSSIEADSGQQRRGGTQPEGRYHAPHPFPSHTCTAGPTDGSQHTELVRLTPEEVPALRQAWFAFDPPRSYHTSPQRHRAPVPAIICAHARSPRRRSRHAASTSRLRAGRSWTATESSRTPRRRCGGPNCSPPQCALCPGPAAGAVARAAQVQLGADVPGDAAPAWRAAGGTAAAMGGGSPVGDYVRSCRLPARQPVSPACVGWRAAASASKSGQVRPVAGGAKQKYEHTLSSKEKDMLAEASAAPPARHSSE